MAARWKITSGLSAISFSTAPATAKSPACTSTGKPGFSGLAGATTSCSVILLMSVLPSRPSLSRRSTNLRPTMPAAPRTKICKRLTPRFLFSWTARSFLHGAGHRRHIMLHKEGVKDHERERTSQGACHQRTPAVDIAVDELVDDGDRHGLVWGRLQEGQ